MIEITKARYAKGKLAARPTGNGTGFKDAEACLCEAIGGRWSNRCHSYIVSPAQARDLLILAAAGWSANVIFPDEHGRDFYHQTFGFDPKFTRAEALKMTPHVTTPEVNLETAH